jgi:hypothetical protein
MGFGTVLLGLVYNMGSVRLSINCAALSLCHVICPARECSLMRMVNSAICTAIWFRHKVLKSVIMRCVIILVCAVVGILILCLVALMIGQYRSEYVFSSYMVDLSLYSKRRIRTTLLMYTAWTCVIFFLLMMFAM